MKVRVFRDTKYPDRRYLDFEAKSGKSLLIVTYNAKTDFVKVTDLRKD